MSDLQAGTARCQTFRLVLHEVRPGRLVVLQPEGWWPSRRCGHPFDSVAACSERCFRKEGQLKLCCQRLGSAQWQAVLGRGWHPLGLPSSLNWNAT
jgi:hypothetical protein